LKTIAIRLALISLMLLTACAESAPERPRVATTSPEPSPSRSPSPSPSFTPGPQNLGRLAAPDFEKGSLGVWTKDKRFVIYRKPKKSSKTLKLKAWNPIGQRLRLLVLSAIRYENEVGWLKVQVPERPNGSKGWIKSDNPALTVDALPYRIEVDLSKFRLKMYNEGKLVHRFKVGVGQDRYPTPKGTFFVWSSAKLDPSGPYGRFALGLSGFSPVLSEWSGGGRSAIHGTAVSSDRGKKVSHGCVRVFNKDLRKLEKVQLGTPVIITA
jgi:lipoprotein-anchoring transpeptidase ErfK/SrfK